MFGIDPSIIPQVAANSLIAGSLYLLVALGFNLIFGTAKFFDLGYGGMTMVGGYLFFMFARRLEIGFVSSIALAIILTGAVGVLVYFLVYRVMRQRKASSLVMLIASLGVMTIIQALVAMFFSSQFHALLVNSPLVYNFANIGITSVQLWMVASALTLSMLTILFMKYSLFGKALKAVRDDEEVAKIVGINTERIMWTVFFVGSAIGAVAGILSGFDTGILPTIGLSLLLKGIISSVIGGAGDIRGGVFGAYLLAFAENFGILFVGSEWRDAIAFSLLIIFLLFRPKGIMNI